jgi:hypothetical protein
METIGKEDAGLEVENGNVADWALPYRKISQAHLKDQALRSISFAPTAAAPCVSGKIMSNSLR